MQFVFIPVVIFDPSIFVSVAFGSIPNTGQWIYIYVLCRHSFLIQVFVRIVVHAKLKDRSIRYDIHRVNTVQFFNRFGIVIGPQQQLTNLVAMQYRHELIGNTGTAFIPQPVVIPHGHDRGFDRLQGLPFTLPSRRLVHDLLTLIRG